MKNIVYPSFSYSIKLSTIHSVTIHIDLTVFTIMYFHPSQLFRTPNFEIIPMDLVMGKCTVLDPNTYSKGRPKGFKEQDVYICEYRVDKTAHLFHKIKEIW